MATIDPINWHGTHDELSSLRSAVVRHCACPSNDGDAPMNASCTAHAMLEDQRTLDHLLFAYRVRRRFTKGEWEAPPVLGRDLPTAA